MIRNLSRAATALAAVFAVALLAGCGDTKTVTTTTTTTATATTTATVTTASSAPQATAGTVCQGSSAAICVLRHQPSPHRAAPLPGAQSVLHGLDGWGPPSLSYIVANGYAFGAAYLSYPQGNSKNWSPAAVNAYKAAHKGVLMFWETTQYRPLSGYAGGVSDALEARRQAAALGNTTGPIVVAVDFDAGCSQIVDYFRGVHSILGARDESYGGYDQVLCLYQHGLVGHENFQTYAWSSGRWLPASIAPAEQYLNGGTYDQDRALLANYGQFYPRSGGGVRLPVGFRYLDRTVRQFGPVRAQERNTMLTWLAHSCRQPVQRTICKTSAAHARLLRERLLQVASKTGWSLYHRARRNAILGLAAP